MNFDLQAHRCRCMSRKADYLQLLDFDDQSVCLYFQHID